MFLSVDTAQGNEQGMNPYAYVNGNPETHSDPTGLRPIQACSSGCNAPVDMGALSAAILAWAMSASAPYKTNAVTSFVPPVTVPPASKYLGGSVQQTPLSSCGISQTACGQYGVHFALYFDGMQFSVPGEWTVEHGQGGGSGDSGGSGGMVTWANCREPLEKVLFKMVV